MKLFLLGMLTAYVVLGLVSIVLDETQLLGGDSATAVFFPLCWALYVAIIPFVWLFYVFRGLFCPVDPHSFHAVCSQYGTTAHRLIGPVFLCHDTQTRWIKRWFFVRVKL